MATWGVFRISAGMPPGSSIPPLKIVHKLLSFTHTTFNSVIITIR